MKKSQKNLVYWVTGTPLFEKIDNNGPGPVESKIDLAKYQLIIYYRRDNFVLIKLFYESMVQNTTDLEGSKVSNDFISFWENFLLPP